MTRDAILELARTSGWTEYSVRQAVEVERLVRFATLVAAAEREACAQLAEEVGDRDTDTHAYDAAAAIRAKSGK